MHAHRRRSNRHNQTILPAVLISIPVFLTIGMLTMRSGKVISPIPESDTPKTTQSKDTVVPTTAPKNTDQLEQEIKTMIGTSWKNYSLFVKSYTNNSTLGINESVIFTAASVNKIPILAALYAQVKAGDVDLDKQLTIQARDIQAYGTGSIQYEGAGGSYTIKALARLMMQQSDNTAAYVLANHIVGITALKQFVTDWGLTQTDIDENKTSAADMEKLMRKILTGEITTPALTQEMLSFLKDSDFEDRLPAKLPSGTITYHKIGNGLGNTHDVGIIVSPKATYYIGILTSDIADEEAAKNLQADISKKVYDFFNL